jgi:hypothetical protein
MAKTPEDQYGKRETERRRDEALRRALNTPPKPHKKKEPAKSGGLKRKSKPKN